MATKPLASHEFFSLIENDYIRTSIPLFGRMKEHSAYEARVAESNKTDIAANIKDYMVLMPIPQREIDLNPELIQNTGW